MSDRQDSHQIALQAVQQGIAKLIGNQLTQQCQRPEGNAVRRAKEILQWDDKAEIGLLELLFDQVNLSDKAVKHERHWWPLRAIADTHPPIPYPLDAEPKNLAEIKAEIQSKIVPLLSKENWENLSFLSMVLEKYGSCLSFGESNVALVDFVKATGAVAAALRDDPNSAEISLVAGDLSGIQDFIYTIASDGALKSLRARSFYLELVTEELVQKLIEQLELPRTNIIYAGGGNVYLLAPAAGTKDKIAELKKQFNQFLLDQFQGKIFLALDFLAFPAIDVGTSNFSQHWQSMVQALTQQKQHKFDQHLTEYLNISDSHTPCKICHRDDTEDLKPLNELEPNSPEACLTCRKMFDLGGRLPRLSAIVRSQKQALTEDADVLILKFKSLDNLSEEIYYNIFDDYKTAQKKAGANPIFLINNWDLNHYLLNNINPLLIGNYWQPSTESPHAFMTAEEFAKTAQGIDRVGYLRMDVDRLGQIFAKGLDEHEHHTLPTLAGLSRQISYFFKVYLNSLAKHRQDNLHSSVKQLTNGDRPNLLFIYAGGDDLFISGAWDEIVEFAFDIYQSFRAYTGYHPDITLSGGISLNAVKYPLYQAAEESGEAESLAKGHGRDSLGLFGDVFKWSEWLGTPDLSVLADEDQIYLKAEEQPILFGVLPFVQRLLVQLEGSQSRSFVRNLLTTAQIQQQMIKTAKEKQPNQVKDIQYYLHLPKIAYTLARLPSRVRNDPAFEPIRTSLKSPYNAPYFRAIATWIELLNRTS